MNRKIYVAGNGQNCYGYSNWVNPTGFTSKIEEADLVLGLGGADVSPEYYNQPNEFCSSSPGTDREEFRDYKRAIQLNKKILGICKGAQWAAALAGGAIFQHVDHPGQHYIRTFDGKILRTNSLHHNLADITKLKPGEDYKLLAWAENLSEVHMNGYGENITCELEPEVVYYPKINFLGFQNHNEMLYRNHFFSEMILWSKDILEKFMTNRLTE